MDLNYSTEELRFVTRCVRGCVAPADDLRQKMESYESCQGHLRAAQDPGQEGLGRSDWPESGAGRIGTPCKIHFEKSAASRNPAADSVRAAHVRAVLSSSAPRRRRTLLRASSDGTDFGPGLLGAGSGSDLAFSRRARLERRPLCVTGQKIGHAAINADLDLLPRPHRSKHRQAPDHLLPAH